MKSLNRNEMKFILGGFVEPCSASAYCGTVNGQAYYVTVSCQLPTDGCWALDQGAPGNPVNYGYAYCQELGSRTPRVAPCPSA